MAAFAVAQYGAAGLAVVHAIFSQPGFKVAAAAAISAPLRKADGVVLHVATLAGIGAARMACGRRRFVAQGCGGADVTGHAGVAVLITGVVKGPRGPDAEVGAAVGVAAFAFGGAGRNVVTGL